MSVLSEWERDPKSLSTWRTKKFRESLLVLEEMAIKTSNGRAQDRLKAFELLTKLLAIVDDVKDELPTRCPKCEFEFVPGVLEDK